MAGNSKLKGYFRPVTWKTYAAIVVGLLLILSIWGAIIGLPMVVYGIYNIASKSGSGGDTAADAALSDYIAYVKKRAHSRTQIDEEDGSTSAETTVLTGFHTRTLDKVMPGIVVSKKDRRVRFNPVTITVLIFGRDQLATYQTAVDLTKQDTTFGELMEEYFYNDVIGIRNEENNWVQTVGNREVTRKTQSVALVASSGDKVEVTIGIDAPSKQDKSAWEQYAEGIQPQINNIKRLLRERKSNSASPR